jgi:MerR family transcriptional regulator, light-induced transcriptional regulator
MEDRSAQIDEDADRAGLLQAADLVSEFASVVVSLLAERSSQKVKASLIQPKDEIIQGFVTAALSGSAAAFDELLGHFRRTHISLAMLADVYIPEAARRMGEDWLDDHLSWLDVSIGVARLQNLLREISAAWTADQADSLGHGAVLLLIPEGEQHTLGPMVAMGQLRRAGVSVCLRIAPSPRELTHLLDQRPFDGVLISVATDARLQSAIALIKLMRAMRKKLPPIVLGGPIVQEKPQLAACAGADFSCIDIDTAMKSIGLHHLEHGSQHRG